MSEIMYAESAAKRMDALEAENALLTALVAMQAEVLMHVAKTHNYDGCVNDALISTAETVAAWKRENDAESRTKAIKECAELFGNRGMRNAARYVNDIEKQILSLLVPATKEKEPT